MPNNMSLCVMKERVLWGADARDGVPYFDEQAEESFFIVAGECFDIFRMDYSGDERV